MLSVSPQSAQPVTTGSAAVAGEREEVAIDLPDMDHLLSKLRTNMVELILQGDDVTRQMWRMYSVFEEIFGSQKISSKPAMKPVVMGDKIQQQAASYRPPAVPPLAEEKPISKPSPNSTSPPPGTAASNGTTNTTAVVAAASATTAVAVTTACAAVTATASCAGSAGSQIVTTATTNTANNFVASTTTVITTTTTAATTIAATTFLCSSPVSTVTVTTATSTTPTSISSTSICSDEAISRHSIPVSQTDRRIPPRNKFNQRPLSMDGPTLLPRPELTKAVVHSNNSSSSSPTNTAIPSATSVAQEVSSSIVPAPTSNPLLDTIGTLAGSNPDSDDSDLDIVYQQLRYRGRQRRHDHGRLRTHQKSQRRHQQHFANSDPESTSYAGSNSIDSGYKSQCATPEVSDTLSAPEVRRSASDVSASDSSTTSGRPRSSDGNIDSKSVKIKMGTRAIAGKFPHGSKRRQPFLESSMNDVTLDHLMYLRQSMRKDYLPSSSHGSMPSSSASSTVREELSPTILTDEESSYGHDMPLSSHGESQQNMQSPQRQRSYLPHSAAYSPTVDGAMFLGGGAPPRSSSGSRSGRRLSSGSEPAPDTSSGTSPTSEFLLSGVEYYDLDSVHDFPQRRSYFAMMEEKSRCSRIHLMAASKRDVQSGKHDPFSKKRKDPAVMRSPPSEASVYGISRHSTRESASIVAHRSHHQPQQQQPLHHLPPPTTRGSDSKLTEAAIRVLQMIEDFRMEEAIGNATTFEGVADRLRPNVTSVGPHAFVPRFRRTSGGGGTRSATMRPASTGSLIGSDDVSIDARSIASSSSYAASAEHHVYEEIMYDLVCERSRGPDHPAMAHVGGAKSRNRYLPANPLAPGVQRVYHHGGGGGGGGSGADRAMMTVRSHKHRSNMYSIVSDEDPMRNSPDPFIDMDWNVARGRRDNIQPDYPV